ncbi:MAG: glutathione S-transferase N-terminal domain-containing protein [Propionibacteriaceae bacterium]|jgi:glutaredoxin|nr:glutathione S-transferase N-terminal domain-containing protein [Propionibacteriaceae bacterium]
MASSTGTTEDAKDHVVLYGAKWCPDCRMAKAVLDAAELEYEYIDLGDKETAPAEAEKISGQRHIPVVVFPDGVWYVEPTKKELALKIEALKGIEPSVDARPEQQ